MKKILLVILLFSICTYTYSQCTPNPAYQNSSYNVWPDTIQNLPYAFQSVTYSTTIDIKTPGTLIEATGGDSSILWIDTTVLGLSVNQYIGDWPVDSMALVSLSGLPNGFNYGCDIPNCVLPGNTLCCAYVNGVTNDPIGVYPITILVNVYTHGTLDLGLIQYPYATDLYSAVGYYEQLPGYKIVVDANNNAEFLHQSEFKLLQNTPNPNTGSTTIIFHSPIAQNLDFEITDIFGRTIYKEKIESNQGVNSIYFNENLSTGIYFYSLVSEKQGLTKKMMVNSN